MDAKLRALYREYGGNNIRFLLACTRAGHIPLGSGIELSALPEIAKHQDIGQTRPAYMCGYGMDIAMHQGLRGGSTIGELVAEYVLSSDAWTLHGMDRQAITDRFLDWLSTLPEHALEELVEDDEIAIDDALRFDIEDLWKDRLGAEVVRLAWAPHAGMKVEAAIQITSTSRYDDERIPFFIILRSLPSTYCRIVSLTTSLPEPDFGSNSYMLLYSV